MVNNGVTYVKCVYSLSEEGNEYPLGVINHGSTL